MNTFRARSALLGTAIALSILTSACGSADTPRATPDTVAESATEHATEAPTKIVNLAGYALDRSLESFVKTIDVDTIAVITDFTFQDPFLLPTTHEEGRDSVGPWAVTPVDAQIETVYRGAVHPGDAFTMIIGGGTVGKVQFVADRELAPSPEEMSKYTQLLVAGKTITIDGVGKVLDPWFVYGANDGDFTNLMDSGSTDPDVTFSLSEFQKALDGAN